MQDTTNKEDENNARVQSRDRYSIIVDSCTIASLRLPRHFVAGRPDNVLKWMAFRWDIIHFLSVGQPYILTRFLQSNLLFIF